MADWLRRGAAARAARQQEQKRQEMLDKAVHRFRLPPNKGTKITFLDGNIGDDGMLDCPIAYEHNLFRNGRWGNVYMCTRAQEPCPLCASGNKASQVAFFTVIDHSKWKSNRDGKIHQNEIRLFVAKSGTLALLERKAQKSEGLAGVTFEVFRSDADKSPAVGDDFEFIKKTPLDQILTAMGVEGPLNFEECVPYYTAAELISEGLGVPVQNTGNVGHTVGTETGGWSPDDEDEDDAEPREPGSDDDADDDTETGPALDNDIPF